MAEALTGVGATSATGSVTPRISIALTGVSASTAIGRIGKVERPGESFDLTVPMVVLALTGTSGHVGALDIEAPPPVLALTGDVPIAGSVELTLPSPDLALAGTTGAAGTLVLTTPRLSISFGDGAAIAIEAPLPTLQLTGSNGAIAALSMQHRLPTLALSGMTETIGTLTINHRLPQLTLEMASGHIGTLNLTQPAPTLRFTGVLGAYGTLAVEAPLPELRLTGHFAAIGTFAIVTPAIDLVMYGVTQGTAAQDGDSGAGATRVTYAFQTERQALTKYTNFAFNSFAVFAGRHLAAGPDGIFELTGDTDAGTAIQAAARFGITDLGTSRVKRVEHVYIGARTAKGEKALLLRVLTNETQQRDYGVKASISDGLHTVRVDLGMGVESRYWQFELRNRDGADFSVDTVEVQPTAMRRRLGAKDA